MPKYYGDTWRGVMAVSLTSMRVVLNEPVSVSAEMSKIYVGGTTCYLGRHLVLLNHIVRAFTLLSEAIQFWDILTIASSFVYLKELVKNIHIGLK